MIITIDMEAAQKLGKRRNDQHLDSSKPHFFEDQNEENIIGIAGEIAFGTVFNVPVDTTDRPNGDGGVDFRIPYHVTVDVKTYRKPFNLLVKETEIDRPVDIYVLARYIEDRGEVELLGWQTRSVMKTQPVKDFGYEIKSHYMAADKLRPMAELIKRTHVVAEKKFIL